MTEHPVSFRRTSRNKVLIGAGSLLFLGLVGYWFRLYLLAVVLWLLVQTLQADCFQVLRNRRAQRSPNNEFVSHQWQRRDRRRIEDERGRMFYE